MSGRAVNSLGSTVASWSMCAYIWILYFKTALLYVAPSGALDSINWIVLAIGVIGACDSIGSGWLNGSLSPLKPIATVAIALPIAAFFGANSGSDSNHDLYDVASVLVCGFVVIGGCKHPGGVRRICTSLVFAAGLNAGIALWGALTHQTLFGVTARDVGVGAFGYDVSSGRSGGVRGENYSGMYNVPAVIGGYLLIQRKRAVWLGAGLVAVGAAGTIVSMSRASVLSVGAAVLTLVVSSTGTRVALRRIPLFLFIAAATVTTGSFISDAYIATLPRSLQADIRRRFSEVGVANDERFRVFQMYWDIAMDHPLTGAGPDVIDDQVMLGGLVPHNSAMDIAVKYGFIACILYLWAIAKPLTNILVLRQSAEGQFCMACYVGMIVPLATLSNSFLRIMWIMGLMTLSYCWRRRQRDKVHTEANTRLRIYLNRVSRRVV